MLLSLKNLQKNYPGFSLDVYTIPPYYDSMVAKLIVWAKNRQEAIRKMQSALGEVIIEGIDTNVDYQYGIVNHPDYIEGNIDIEFIERL